MSFSDAHFWSVSFFISFIPERNIAEPMFDRERSSCVTAVSFWSAHQSFACTSVSDR